MSTLEVKDNSKRAALQIKILAINKAVEVGYGRSIRPRIMRKKKARTGVLPARKKNKNNNTKHIGIQRCCMILKKDGTTERKCMLHSDETWFGKRSDQESLKKGLELNLRNRNTDVKKFQKADNKWSRELKHLKN